MTVGVDPIDIAIVGFGKIAREQHLPAIQANPRFRLAATVALESVENSVPHFRSLEELLASGIDFQAVAICTPPNSRNLLARESIAAQKGVMLEKPPGTTVREFEELAAFARLQGTTLYTAWHSRKGPAVKRAREWLSSRIVHSISIVWREDVNFWHPGQEWIFEAGGFGVFDAGINALSLLTELIPGCIVTSADLFVPTNREAPIATRMSLTANDVPISADFDFRQAGLHTWEIGFATDAGQLVISKGGVSMAIDGRTIPVGGDDEYRVIYAEFAELLSSRESSADIRPLQLVADAFLLGRHHPVEEFHFC